MRKRYLVSILLFQIFWNVCFAQCTFPISSCSATWNGNTYKLMNVQLDWETAQNHSIDSGANSYLATITSLAEQQFIFASFSSLGYDFWLGGADKYNNSHTHGSGFFKWQWGPDRNFVFYDQFNRSCVPGQYCNMISPPNIAQWAIRMTWNNTGKWIATDMLTTLYYLVESGGPQPPEPDTSKPFYNPYNMHFYQFVKFGIPNYQMYINATYQASQQSYLGLNGYLATITSAQEHNFIVQTFGDFGGFNTQHVYLGATDEGHEGNWTWATRETFSFYSDFVPHGFTFFNPGEPNNQAADGENYLSWDGGSGWNDVCWECTLSNYIVEFDCVDNCSGNGGCAIDGSCICNSGFFGAHCECNCKSDVCCIDNCTLAADNTTCRNSTGLCDPEEHCQQGTCPPDIVADPNYPCRMNDSKCDITEVCGSSTSECPINFMTTDDACGVCGGDNSSCGTSDGVCGDGYCNTNIKETCEICPLDCGHCVSECELPCVNGACFDGNCVCQSPWTGPQCNLESVPAEPEFNNSLPSFSFSWDDDKATKVYFSISLSHLQELDSYDSAASEKITIIPQNVSFHVSKSDTGNAIYQYKINLTNNAYMFFVFTQYKNATTLKFANVTFTAPPNSVKSTIYVFDWPFKSINNKLRFWSDMSSSEMNGCQTLGQDESNNIKWIKYTVNGISLFSQFLGYAEIDGFSKVMEVLSDSESEYSITFTVPHFWSYVAIDPTYNILVDPSERCGKSRVTKTIIIATVIPILVVAALILAAAIVWRRKQLQIVDKKTRVGGQ